MFDKEDERKSKYQSEVRGRVQDKNVRVDIEPQFVLTYYEKPDQVKKLVYYDKMIEAYNNERHLSMLLRLTNQEAALNEYQVAQHFTSIDNFSAKIDANTTNANLYFGRGLDYMLVQDFTEAIKDFDKVIALDPSFVMAYFNRAIVRYKQLEYDLSHASDQDDLSMLDKQLNIGFQSNSQSAQQINRQNTQSGFKDNKRAYEHEMIVRDYDMAIKLNPDFVYAYFNRGNLRCSQKDFRAAVLDYNEAISRDPEFAEAYFNRGLARLSLGDANRGIADLSKAGELGIINAYNIIKRMTSN